MTKIAGSSDLRQRTRRKKTVSEKADSRREKETKKRKIEAELREKNKAKGWFSVPAPAHAPAHDEPDSDQPEPLDMRDGSDDDDDDDDNVYVDISEPGLLPSTTTSVEDYNIIADMDIEEDDNFEDAEEENDTSSVMGLYLLAIQKMQKVWVFNCLSCLCLQKRRRCCLST